MTVSAPSSTADDTSLGPGPKYPGVPRWVKILGIIVVVAILVAVIAIFLAGHTSPVQHGP